MKKILIATTNKDKFKIVSYILRRAGISEDLYEILSLNDINYDGPDIIEVGDILKRARVKAETIKNFFQNEIYDYFIGIDDGIILKGNMIENVKEYIKKILYENYLSEGEKIIFPRAYCIIGRDNNQVFQDVIEIPYVYMPRDNVSVEKCSYPLSQIAVPIGYDKPIIELTIEESNDYYWKYSEVKIKKLVKCF